MESQKKGGQSRRAIVIGLDGATFDVLNPLVEDGKMPNLGKAMKHGTAAELISTIPPVTGPSWVSFMTGKKPENHGVFDFVQPQAGSYNRNIINYSSIKSKTLWPILSQHGKKLSIINVPITYPPPEVNGVLISGMLTPEARGDYTYPDSLKDVLRENVGEYKLDLYWQEYNKNVETMEKFLEDLLHCNRQRIKASMFLFKNYEADFFMSVFIGTDRIQHFLWDYLEAHISGNAGAQGSGKKKGNRIIELIIRYYQEVDEYIGQMIDAMDDRTSLIIMSDHGFGPLKGRFNINRWLESNGFLAYHPKKLRLFRLRKAIAPLRPILKKIDFLNLRQHLLSRSKGNAGRAKGYHFLDCINWDKTKAYSVSTTEQGIYINLQGREPNGSVKPEEYEHIRDSIIEALRSVKEPKTGTPLVSDIHRREDIYSGTYAEQAPDIIFFLREGEYIATVQPSNVLFEETNLTTGSGTHRLEGIFLGLGNGINQNARIDPISITDLAPTILHVMGLPVPDDMDGSVAETVFTKRFMEENPIEFTHADAEEFLSQAGDDYSQEEQEALEEKLRGLGYMQ